MTLPNLTLRAAKAVLADRITSFITEGMSIQQLLITEVSQQPEPLLREVWHYLSFLKAKSANEQCASLTVRPGYGSVPGIELADDFDAPLEAFADYRP